MNARRRHFREELLPNGASTVPSRRIAVTGISGCTLEPRIPGTGRRNAVSDARSLSRHAGVIRLRAPNGGEGKGRRRLSVSAVKGIKRGTRPNGPTFFKKFLATLPTEPSMAEPRQLDRSDLFRLLLTRGDKLTEYLSAKVHPRLRPTVCNRDLIQSIWAKALASFDQCTFRSERALDRWLFVIGYNELIDQMRAAQRAPRSYAPDWLAACRGSCALLFAWLRSPCKTPSSLLASEELGELLRFAIADLPGRDHEIAWARFMDNQSVMQISESLGLSPSDVKRVLVRCRGRIRQVLNSKLEPWRYPGGSNRM